MPLIFEPISAGSASTIAIAEERLTSGKEIVMPTPRASLAVAALVVGMLATVSTGSFADTAVSSPNVINNATHDAPTVTPQDPYRDQPIFPQWNG